MGVSGKTGGWGSKQRSATLPPREARNRFIQDDPSGKNTPPLHTPKTPLHSAFTGHSEIGKLIEDRPRDLRLQAAAHMDIGRGSSVSGSVSTRIGLSGPANGLVADIGGEDKPLLASFAFHLQEHRQERRVLDRIRIFSAGVTRMETVGIFAQDGGEQPHQLLAADGRALMKPGAVARDSDVDVAAMGRVPFSTGGRPRQLAASRCRLANPMEKSPLMRPI